VPHTIKGNGLWLWTPAGKTKVERAIREEGAGDATVKSLNTWLTTTEKISKEAITKPIKEKYEGPKGKKLGLDQNKIKEFVQKEIDKTEVTFQSDADGNVSILVSGRVITKKKLW
jgi:hypothetical protein